MKLDAATAKVIADRLAGPLCSIELLVDGHRVTAVVARISSKAMTYGVTLYIDGLFRGEFSKVDNPIGAKFFPLRTRQLLRAKDYAAHRKAFGKRAADDFRKRSTYQYRECYFRTGRAFASHLRKHAESVEIVEAEAASS